MTDDCQIKVLKNSLGAFLGNERSIEGKRTFV